MLKRNTKYALFAVGGLCSVVIAWMFLSNAVAKRALGAVKAELVAKGARLEIAEIYSRPNEDRSNGARQLLDALSMLPDMDRRLVRDSMGPAGPGRAFRLSQLTNWPAELAEKKWVDEVWAVIPPIVDPIRHTLDRALTAATNDVVFFDLPFREKHVGTLLRHLAPIRNLYYLTVATTLHDLRLGEGSAARIRLVQATRLLASFDEPQLISQLVRFAAMRSLALAVWEALAVADWEDAEWAEMQTAWLRIDLTDPMFRALEMERAVGLRYWEELLRDPQVLDHMGMGSSTGGPVENLMTAVGDGDWDEIKDASRGLFWPISVAYADAAIFAETMQTNLTVFQSRVTSRTFTAGAGYPGEVPDEFLFSGMILPPLERVDQKVAHAEVIRWMTVTAIALKRFAIVHRRLPERLEELVPRFLDSVPIDWYDGKPLRYERGNDGTFKLWSVGQDGLDDGAKIFDPKKSWDGDRDIYWPQPATAGNIADRRQELELQKAAAPRP
jgi:hypothetical protein